MSKLFLTLTVALALAAFIGFGLGASKVNAQAVPDGSYQQTCRNIEVSAAGISAECQRRDGTWKETSLSSYGFPCDEIENDDGDLVCVGASN